MSDEATTTPPRRRLNGLLKATDQCIAILEPFDEDQRRRAVLWLTEEFDIWPEERATIPRKGRDEV